MKKDLVLKMAGVVVAALLAGPMTPRADAQTVTLQSGQQTASTTDVPTGWVGVSIQQNANEHEVQYPTIVTVEPGSPAQQAGLAAGDTLLSYGDADARKGGPTAIRRFLVPNRKLLVRYRRNGVKETTILVGKRPNDETLHFEFSVGSDSNSNGIPNEIKIQLEGLLTILAPMTGRGGVVVAGANLAPMNEGLADATSAPNTGAFVVNVVPNTPADQAGLQSGDIITAADKAVVKEPGDIVRVMYAKQEQKGRKVALRVQRKGKAQLVSLHW